MLTTTRESAKDILKVNIINNKTYFYNKYNYFIFSKQVLLILGEYLKVTALTCIAGNNIK